MIDFLLSVLMAASMAVAISCTAIGAGLLCVMGLRDLVRRIRGW